MTKVRGGFPRRDDEGRIVSLADLTGVVLAGVVVGFLTLILFDGVFALLDQGEFGQANGWLAVVLPAWLFVEEFRSWNIGPARLAAALVAVALGLAAGLLVAGLASVLPPLGAGAIGAAVFAVSYAVVWYFGVRWLAHRTG